MEWNLLWRLSRSILVLCALALFCLSCGSAAGGPQCKVDGDCEEQQYCATDGNCYQRVECQEDEDCADDEYCSDYGECRKKPILDGHELPVCDYLEIEPSAIPPNLLLVVDKSGSMKDPTAAGSGRTKIQDAKEALTAMLDAGDGSIRFGWLQYPSGSSCTPGNVSVECADDSVASLRSKVSALIPDGGTPTGESLQNANSYQGLHDELRSNFVVLLTDGMPTCPTGGGREQTAADSQLALAAVQALYASNVDTFVIGLGEDLNDPDTTNPELLNQMALAGGRARAGQTSYYAANSLDELNQALDTIGGMVIGCSLGLSSIPEHPDYLWVFFDGKNVERDRDHINGWDYDPVRNQTNFYGPACDRLRAGDVDRVEVIVGCAPPA